MHAPRYRLVTVAGFEVEIEAGRIARAGRARAERGRGNVACFHLGPGELRPGLINAHDHLHRNHYPRLGSPPYPDAYAWGRDLHENFAAEIAAARSVPRRDALLFGALKNLLGAATTAVHHDAWEPAFDDAFPIRVPRLRTAHSLGFERDLRTAVAGDAATAGRPLAIHLAEGVNADAAEEVRTLERLGLLDDRLLAVHCVGTDADGTRRLRAARAAIVWCPTSNLFLFGRTAPPALLAPGADVLIGSDSLLTGQGTLLDELRAARRTGLIDDRRLLDAAGPVAARRLGLPAPSLEPGAPADLVHLRRPVLDAGPTDVALALVGGVPRIGEDRYEALFRTAGVETRRVRVQGETRLVAAPLAEAAARIIVRWPERGLGLDP